MKRKRTKVILIVLLCVSVIGNVYFGITRFLESTYTPNEYDRELLAEMTKMTIDSEQYKEIAKREEIYGIEQGVSRFNVSNPTSVYHYEIHVQTDEETYIFTCSDEACSAIDIGGWSYSRFSDTKPILPLKK